jgi:hypothetical protein
MLRSWKCFFDERLRFNAELLFGPATTVAAFNAQLSRIAFVFDLQHGTPVLLNAVTSVIMTTHVATLTATALTRISLTCTSCTRAISV